jgi:inorganic pyrophosphatase
MTAVEWLVEQIFEKHTIEWQKQIEQAKAMEKDQIISFGEWYSGMEKEKVQRAYNRYLNETFKSE